MQAARQDERLRPAAAHQADPAADSSDNILSLLARTQQPGRWPSERKPGNEPDWSVALDLVQQAAVAIRVSAERTEAMETRARSLWARATQEIERAQARIGELEARLQDAEARASTAEAEVAEAREWAQRIHAALAAELSAGAKLLHNKPSLAPTKTLPDNPASTGAMDAAERAIAAAAVDSDMDQVVARFIEAQESFHSP